MSIDEKEFRRVADELAIRDLVSRYCDAVIRSDANDWGNTWAEDASWEVMGNVAKGREQIVATWKSLMSMFTFVAQFPHHGVLQIEGDRGKGRWMVTEHGRTEKGDNSTLTMGMYADEYVRVDGRWYFASRKFNLMHAGPPDLSGPLSPLPGDL